MDDNPLSSLFAALAALLVADIDTTGGRNLTAMTVWSWSRVFGAPMDRVVDPSALPPLTLPKPTLSDDHKRDIRLSNQGIDVFAKIDAQWNVGIYVPEH